MLLNTLGLPAVLVSLTNTKAGLDIVTTNDALVSVALAALLIVTLTPGTTAVIVVLAGIPGPVIAAPTIAAVAPVVVNEVYVTRMLPEIEITGS